jgi:hypothetical protein
LNCSHKFRLSQLDSRQQQEQSVLRGLQIVVTSKECIANQASTSFGQFPLLVPDMDTIDLEVLISRAKAFALEKGLWDGCGIGVVMHGSEVPCADGTPVMHTRLLGIPAASERLGSRAFSLTA